MKQTLEPEAGVIARSASAAALAAALTVAAFIGGDEPTCGSGANAEDIQIWAALEGDSAFQTAFAPYFNLQKKHWDEGWGWGKSAPSHAFSKMMTAGFLLRTGVDSMGLGGVPPRSGAGRPRHSSRDYARWASGSVHGFRYQPRNQTTRDGHWMVYGHAIMGWRAKDRVEMWCPSLNLASDPGHRAATMLHEATHIQYGDWNGVWRHDTGGKDDWYPHTLIDMNLGELDQARRRGFKHSAYQIEVEFLADLSEFPAPWVPLVVSRAARATGNQLIRTRFRNTVPFTIGVPRH
jgi:hypothetical protein